MTDTTHNKGITLYSRPDCHLCDEAMALLVHAGLDATVAVVDIEPDLKLLSRYGDKVPVLRWAEGHELRWPFSLEDILNHSK